MPLQGKERRSVHQKDMARLFLRKGLPAQWQSNNTAMEAQYRGELPFFDYKKCVCVCMCTQITGESICLCNCLFYC